MNPELLRELLVWVALTLGGSAADLPLPRVLVVPSLEVGPEVGRPPSQFIRAAYDRSRELIVLGEDDCERVDSVCKAILIHELVHYYLHKTDRAPTCLGAEERIAYTTSYRWVVDHDPLVMGSIALDPMVFLLATTCEEML